MTDITLKPIKSGYNLQKINDNFEIIETNINTTSLQSTGGNNVLSQDIDMDGSRILNLPLPQSPTDPVRLLDIETVSSSASTFDLIEDLSQSYDFKTIAFMQASSIVFPVGKKVFWKGYYDESDGGSNWGVVKSGAHTDDGGSIFTLADGKYVVANQDDVDTDVQTFGVVEDAATDRTAKFAIALQYAYDNDKSLNLCNGILLDGEVDISYMDFRAPIVIKNGTILRAAAGSIFTATLAGDNNRDAPVLEDVRFIRPSGVNVPSVFDVDGSRRHQSYGCYYREFCFYSGTNFSQSLRFSKGNTVYLQPAPFFQAETFYDLKINGNQFETSAFPLLEADGTVTPSGPYAITGGAFNENLIEGYTTAIPFVIPHCKNFSIDDNYFEGNLSLLQQRHLGGDPNTVYRLDGFSCVRNFIGAVKSNVVLDVPVGKLGNNDIALNDVIFTTPDLINNVFIKDNLTQSTGRRNTVNGGILVPSSSRVFNDTVSDSADTSLALRYELQAMAPGIRVVVKDFLSRATTTSANTNLCFNTFIVTISGQSNVASVNYRFNYVGMLSFASADNAGTLSLEVSMTPQVNMHTDGSIAVGATGVPADVLVKFPNNTKLKPFTEAHAQNQLYFELPNIISVDNVCMTPMNNTIVQSGFHVLPFYAT